MLRIRQRACLFFQIISHSHFVKSHNVQTVDLSRFARQPAAAIYGISRQPEGGKSKSSHMIRVTMTGNW